MSPSISTISHSQNAYLLHSTAHLPNNNHATDHLPHTFAPLKATAISKAKDTTPAFFGPQRHPLLYLIEPMANKQPIFIDFHLTQNLSSNPFSPPNSWPLDNHGTHHITNHHSQPPISATKNPNQQLFLQPHRQPNNNTFFSTSNPKPIPVVWYPCFGHYIHTQV